ncbi:MAG: peptidylprolyl isomerase [Methylococcaceae bacterium]|nr:peptidylprolyl isomerase [Methylococcaceae bacterium]
MNKKSLTAAAVASLLLFGGCDKKANNETPIKPTSGTPPLSANSPAAPPAASAPPATPAVKPTPENTVAIVNGKPISRSTVQAVMAELTQRSGGHGGVPEEKIVDGLIARELLKQEAEKQNLASDPEVAAKIENATRDALVQAEVENLRKTIVVPDEELKAEYDKRIVAAKQTEFKARHILLETEQAAKDVLAKLQKGQKFEDLAKKLSKDPSAKQNAGDLGWFNPQQMVPEFSQALAGLKNGETTQAPVKSQFGWHVIQRQDSREQEPPPFDSVKEQLRNMLVGQKLQKHVEDLKASAKIEHLTPPAPPKAEEAPAGAPAEGGEPKAPPAPEEDKSQAPQAEPSEQPAPAAPAPVAPTPPAPAK